MSGDCPVRSYTDAIMGICSITAGRYCSRSLGVRQLMMMKPVPQSVQDKRADSCSPAASMAAMFCSLEQFGLVVVALKEIEAEQLVVEVEQRCVKRFAQLRGQFPALSQRLFCQVVTVEIVIVVSQKHVAPYRFAVQVDGVSHIQLFSLAETSASRAVSVIWALSMDWPSSRRVYARS